jgi:hypothetical protein
VSLIVDTDATANITEEANSHLTVSSFGIPYIIALTASFSEFLSLS